MTENQSSIVTHSGDRNLRDSWIKNPQMIVEKVLRNPAITCSITMPVQKHETNVGTSSYTTTIPFYMSDDFKINSMSAKFEPLFGEGSGIFGGIQELLRISDNINNTSQVTLQSEPMSALMWKGSEFSGFDIECLFVCTRREINPVNIIKTLSACVLPNKLVLGDKSLGLTNDIMNAIKATKMAQTSFNANVASFASDMTKTLVDSGKDFFGSACATQIKETGTNIINGAKEAGQAVANSEVAQSVGGAISSAAQKADDYTGNAASHLISGTGDNIKKAVGTQISDIKQIISKLGLEESSGNIIGALTSDNIQEQKQKAMDIIADAGMIAPLYYKLDYSSNGDSVSMKPNPDTCVTLQIGNYMTIPDLVVTSISGIMFSKELVAPNQYHNSYNKNDLYKYESKSTKFGYPIWAKCSLSLRPATLVTYKKFCEYFRGPCAGDPNKIYNDVAGNKIFGVL